MPELQVLFIRHGESENNTLHDQLRAELPRDLATADRLFRERRSYDPPLTPTGAKQVTAVAQRVLEECKGDGLREIWVSYLRRALDTAAAIHEAVPDAEVLVMDDIHEVGGSYCWDAATGAFTGVPGTTPTQIRNTFPTFQVASRSTDDAGRGDDEGWYTLPSKEPHSVAADRCDALIDRLELRCLALVDASTHGNNHAETARLCLAVITHGDFFKVLMKRLHDRLVRGFSVAESNPTPPPWFEAEKQRPSDSWIQNTSVTRFQLQVVGAVNSGPSDVDKGGEVVWRVVYFADASHLSSSSV